MITSDANFEWVATILIAAISIGWFIVDTVNLRRELAKAKPERHRDRLFGYVIGLILATLGGVGVTLFHLS